MERLYCPECGNYLEGGDGSMNDCHCGWKQERYIESDDDELETLRAKVAQLEAALREAKEALDSCEWYSPGSCYLFDPDAVEKAIATIKEVIK